jgi:hypothetical protein
MPIDISGRFHDWTTSGMLTRALHGFEASDIEADPGF